ncbi:MAG: hypothetical protein NTX64_02785 [Elusimicrobia bacterium]|nr:hypothetical protein [Elusimicrobiota bacterium]
MEQSEEGKGQVVVDQIPPESVSGSAPQAAEARVAPENPAPEKTAEQPAPQESPKPAPEAVAQPAVQPEAAPQAASEPAPQAQAEPVPQAEAAPSPELAAQPAAEPAAAEAAPPAPPAPKPPVKRIPKPRGSSAFDAELATLLDQIYSEYDFQQVEGGLVGTIIADLWPLPPEAKGQPPKGGGGKSKEKWPPRTSLDGPRDYRLHIYLSTVKDPSWSLSGKDLQAICADRASGLLLLMADQKGFFLPSGRLRDFSDLLTPTPAGVFKISGTKLRKGGIARFFSMAGFARELTDARANR